VGPPDRAKQGANEPLSVETMQKELNLQGVARHL
jgi:hypothetical protein